MTESTKKISILCRLIQLISSIIQIVVASIAIHGISKAVSEAGRKYETTNTILFPALAIPSGGVGIIFSIALLTPFVRFLSPLIVISMDIFALGLWSTALALNAIYYAHLECEDTWLILNWSNNVRRQDAIIKDYGIELNCFLGKGLIVTSAFGCALWVGLIVLVACYSFVYAYKNHLCTSTRFFICGGIFPKDASKLEIILYDSPLQDDSSGYHYRSRKFMNRDEGSPNAW